MSKRLLLFAILLAYVFAPVPVRAVVWYTTDAYGNADANDKCNYFKLKDSGLDGYGISYEVVYQITPNTKYCRIYKYTSSTSTTADNYDNFPDGTLRHRLARHFTYWPGAVDNNQRGFYITEEEAHAVTSLDLSAASTSASSIDNLQGIQIFSNLVELNLANNNSWKLASGYIDPDVYTQEEHDYFNLPAADMRKASPSNQGNAGYNEAQRHYLSYMLLFFKHLEVLNCSNTKIEYLHVNGTRANPKPLRQVNCQDCPYLVSVKGNYTNIDSLNVNGCGYLTTLEVHHANLNYLNVVDNVRLQTFDVQYNNLKWIFHNEADTTVRRIYLSPDQDYSEDWNNDPATGIYPYLEILTVRNNQLRRNNLSHLEGCPSLRQLKCQYNQLTSLDFHDDANLEGVWCGNNQITSLVFYNDNTLHTLECQNNLLTSLDFEGQLSNLQYLDCSGNPGLNSLVFDHAGVGHPYLHTVYAYSCALTDESNLNFSTLTGLQRLRLSNNTLSTIDLSSSPLVEDIYINNCGINTITGLENLSYLKVFMANNNNLTNTDFSNLTELVTFHCTQNQFTELDLSASTKLKTLICDAQGGYSQAEIGGGRKLRVLKLNSDSLTALKCDNNALLSLDLSNCPNLDETGLLAHSQRSIQDLVVIDHNKLAFLLPNGAVADAESDFESYVHTWNNCGVDPEKASIISRDLDEDGTDEQYLVFYDLANGSANADADYYGKNLTYCYFTLFDAYGTPDADNALGKSTYFSTNGGTLGTVILDGVTHTGVNVSAQSSRANENITVKVYPYVMYINPSSRDVFTTPAAPFYSGTIYLDYDAIVPAGTTAYIATSVNFAKEEWYSSEVGQYKTTSDQLQLVPLVPGEGATEVVIPALTPVYVKSTTETGLFGFDRNNHGGVAQPLGVAKLGDDVIDFEDNIFEGVLTDSAVAMGEVLALGRGQVMGETELGEPTSESRIGFWPSRRTTIPAHRAFIRASRLGSNSGVSLTRGLTLGFSDYFSEDDQTITGLRGVAAGHNDGEWYTVSGIRLSGKPSLKGVYIHNGKKEVIE